MPVIWMISNKRYLKQCSKCMGTSPCHSLEGLQYWGPKFKILGGGGPRGGEFLAGTWRRNDVDAT